MEHPEAIPTKARCAGTRKDGQPCTAPALAGGYCYTHDPARAAEREEARRRGGRGRATRERLLRYAPLPMRLTLEKLVQAMEAVEDGRLDPRRAIALAALGRAAVAVFEQTELLARVAMLEAQVMDLQAKEAREEAQNEWPASAH